MILCVDIKALKTSEKVQKDIDLEDLLLNHTKYYDSTEEAFKDEFVPLDFCVTTRSVYTNLVMQIEEDGKPKYYKNLSEIQPFIHKGIDLVMYLTSIGLMHCIDYKLGFDELMTKHSQFQPVGIYNPEPNIINPIIYSHIILSDEGAEDMKDYLKSNVEFVLINDMNKNRELGCNLPALLDTIIEVEEEKKDE